MNKAVPSAGLLFVYIDQADGLPVGPLKGGVDTLKESICIFINCCLSCLSTVEEKWERAKSRS